MQQSHWTWNQSKKGRRKSLRQSLALQQLLRLRLPREMQQRSSSAGRPGRILYWLPEKPRFRHLQPLLQQSATKACTLQLRWQMAAVPLLRRSQLIPLRAIAEGREQVQMVRNGRVGGEPSRRKQLLIRKQKAPGVRVSSSSCSASAPAVDCLSTWRRSDHVPCAAVAMPGTLDMLCTGSPGV